MDEGKPFHSSTSGALNIPYLYRICPGKELADASLFITIALVIATLTISKARDAHGVEITPIKETINGVIRSVIFPFLPVEIIINILVTSHLKPFKCDIAPRSAKAALLIEQANEKYPQESKDSTLLRRYQKEHNLEL